MSAIYLNLADVRNLLARLGEPSPEICDLNEAKAIIAEGLGVTVDYLELWLALPPIDTVSGVEFSNGAFLALARAVTERKFDQLKNTQRLEIVASTFGRKADAMMHKLKRDTGSLGRNMSLEMAVSARFLSQMRFQHMLSWSADLVDPEGLYVVAANPWNAAMVLAATVKHVRSSVKMNVIEAVVSENFSIEDSFAIASRNDVIVVLRNVSCDAYLDAALKYGRVVPVILSGDPVWITQALRERKRTSLGQKGGVPVRILTLENSAGQSGVSLELMSSFESFEVVGRALSSSAAVD